MTDILTKLCLVGAAVLFAAWLVAACRNSFARGLAAVRQCRAAFLVFVAMAAVYAQKPGGGNSPQGGETPDVVQDGGGEGAVQVTNLCITGISVSSGEATLSLAWPTNFLASGSCLDFFAKVGSLTNGWEWIGCRTVEPAQTNLAVAVVPEDLACETNMPESAFFRVTDRGTSAATMRDADGDGLPDVYELHNGTNPYVPDAGSAPRLTVGEGGDFANLSAAIDASEPYSIIELSAGEHLLSDSVVMPDHPVMVTGPENGYAVLRSAADIAVMKLTDGQGSETLFRNLVLVLEHDGNYQAGFWIGGDLPWSGVGASPTFENVRIRAPNPNTLYYGWHYYRDGGGTSVVSNCVMNAAGATAVVGVWSLDGPDVSVADCHFVNFPMKNENHATYFRTGTNIVAEYAAPEPGLSWAGYPLVGEYSATTDSDGDGLSDYDEIFVYDTDPWLADSDSDGVPDGVETADGTDPRQQSSFLRRLTVVVTADDSLSEVTNYVAWGTSATGWETNGIVACASSPSTNGFEIAASDGVVLAKAFRDLNRNGEYDEDADVMLSSALPPRVSYPLVSFAFGDVDGDKVSDIDELAEGTDPYDPKNHCFNLSLVEHGVVRTTNNLSVAVTFGGEAVYGPSAATNRTWEADVGHLVATNREQVVVCFWDDANSNGVRDAEETFVSHGVTIRGHENVVTNTFPTHSFDRDGDGIPDWWEGLNADAGLSPTNAADAYLDLDGDGLVNLHEYWADCDPLTYDGTNTAIYAAIHSIDDELTASNSQGRLEYYNVIGASAVTFNTNCWARGIDISCMSVLPSQRSATLITRKHFICAEHFHLNMGGVYSFADRDGDVYDATVSQLYRIGDTDMMVGELDQPLPGSIVPAKILPVDYGRYLGSGRKVPALHSDSEKKAAVADLYTIDGSYIYASVPDSEMRQAYYEHIVGGDSGHPRFLVFGDEVVLLDCVHRGPDSPGEGPSITYYKEAIQQAIESFGDTNTWTMTEFDFSPYNELPNY